LLSGARLQSQHTDSRLQAALRLSMQALLLPPLLLLHLAVPQLEVRLLAPVLPHMLARVRRWWLA
jgi:hypothetical protein